LRHRSGGLPARERADGVKAWWVNGKLHRDGGLPAVVKANGDKSWWVNGNLHRDRGLPAVVKANGDKSWWLDGVNITAFREKYLEVHRIRAQKRIYFWIIQRLLSSRKRFGKTISREELAENPKGDGGVSKLILNTLSS
jgi:hypothetical protein